MPTWAAILIPIVVAIVGPILTYRATTRVASGKVSTTAADQLWSELNTMKNEYRDQAREAERENVGLRGQVAEVQTVCASLRERVVEVERHAEAAEALAATARAATAECERRERALLIRLRKLEGKG
jgi:hypothetical protein